MAWAGPVGSRTTSSASRINASGALRGGELAYAQSPAVQVRALGGGEGVLGQVPLQLRAARPRPRPARGSGRRGGRPSRRRRSTRPRAASAGQQLAFGQSHQPTGRLPAEPGIQGIRRRPLRRTRLRQDLPPPLPLLRVDQPLADHQDPAVLGGVHAERLRAPSAGPRPGGGPARPAPAPRRPRRSAAGPRPARRRLPAGGARAGRRRAPRPRRPPRADPDPGAPAGPRARRGAA